VRKLSVARTRWVLVVAAVTLLVRVAFAGPGLQGKFKTLGKAQLVSGGISPHERAADLTSNCGAEPFNATCYNDPTWVFSGVGFTPKGSLTLAGITTLSTDYNMNGTDCSGGSPRFVIITNSHNYVANFGHPPYGGGCYYGWQNTGNFTSTADGTLRWQIDLANTFDSWSTVVASHGTEMVTEINIILDAGWIAPRGQDVTIDNYTVNNKVMEAEDAFPHGHDHE